MCVCMRESDIPTNEFTYYELIIKTAFSTFPSGRKKSRNTQEDPLYATLEFSAAFPGFYAEFFLAPPRIYARPAVLCKFYRLLEGKTPASPSGQRRISLSP